MINKVVIVAFLFYYYKVQYYKIIAFLKLKIIKKVIF